MKVSVALFVVLDTETTGLDPAVDELLEIGAVIVDAKGHERAYFQELIKPSRPLTPDNSAIHGLMDEDFDDAFDLSTAASGFRQWIIHTHNTNAIPSCLVAHNLIFDAGFLPKFDDLMPALCTKRLAQHLIPDAPNYKNQTLRYYFKDVARLSYIRNLGAAHRALADARVTAAVLPKLLDLYLAAGHPDDLAALIDFSNAPIYTPAMPFGKHKGKMLVDIERDDPSYMRWLLGTDLDADMRYSVSRALGLAGAMR